MKKKEYKLAPLGLLNHFHENELKSEEVQANAEVSKLFTALYCSTNKTLEMKIEEFRRSAELLKEGDAWCLRKLPEPRDSETPDTVMRGKCISE